MTSTKPEHQVEHREPRDPYRVRRWFSVGANLPQSRVRQVVEIDRKRQRVLLELECAGFDKGAAELDNA